LTSQSHPAIIVKDRYNAAGRTWENTGIDEKRNIAARLVEHIAGKEEPQTKLEIDIGVGKIAYKEEN
jgi:hypothetical protein